MQNNTQALTLALARRLAIADKRNQQAAIVQTAANLLQGADDVTKENLLILIAATPSERQRVVALVEKMFLAA